MGNNKKIPRGTLLIMQYCHIGGYTNIRHNVIRITSKRNKTTVYHDLEKVIKPAQHNEMAAETNKRLY